MYESDTAPSLVSVDPARHWDACPGPSLNTSIISDWCYCAVRTVTYDGGRMRFGIYLNPSTPGPNDDGRRIAEVLDQCKLAESLGFTSLWLTEQHFTPYNTYADSLVMAGHLAALTPSMRIGFAVIVPTLHHPVRLAEQIALLDNLTNGRIIVGLGVGAGALELAGFGEDFGKRHDRFEETAELLVTLWEHQGGVMEYETSLYKGKIDGRVIPRPKQQPYPLLARASRDPNRIEAWGKRGQPILLQSRGPEWIGEMLVAHERGLLQAPVDDERREAAREASGIHHVVYVAATDEQAKREFQPYWDKHLVHNYYANKSIPLKYEELPPEQLYGYTRDQLICGSPETVTAELKKYEAIGVRQHMVWANVGDIPDDLVQGSLRLFAKEVLPAFG